MHRPTQSRAVREWKNEPWPQSCWIMNMRIMNPAVGNAMRTVSQYPTSRLRSASHQKKRNGMTDVRSWPTLRRVSAPTYGSRMRFQRSTAWRSGLRWFIESGRNIAPTGGGPTTVAEDRQVPSRSVDAWNDG